MICPASPLPSDTDLLLYSGRLSAQAGALAFVTPLFSLDMSFFSSPAVCFCSRPVDSAPLLLPFCLLKSVNLPREECFVVGTLNIAIIREVHPKRVESAALEKREASRMRGEAPLGT